MALFESLFKGMEDVNNYRRNKVLADYAEPYAREGLFKEQTENQYLPEKLRLANQHQGLVNKWYEPNIQSEIGQRNASARKSMQGSGGDAGDTLTKSRITANQALLQAIDNTLPLIDDLHEFDSPGQFIGGYLHPTQQANYDAKVATITDSLVASLGLPKTNESLSLMEKVVRRRPYEGEEAYKQRLIDLKNDLLSRRERSVSALRGDGFSNLKSKKNTKSSSEGRTFNLATGKFE